MRYYSEVLLRPAVTGSFIILLIMGYMYIYGFGIERFKPEAIGGIIASLGSWGPLVYVFCNIVRPLMLFPAAILAVAGGLAFGPFWGAVYLIIGTVLGAVLCFFLARYVGGERFGRLIPQRVSEALCREGATKATFGMLVVFRLLPFLPWDGVSFGAGFTKVGFWPYFFATVIGSIPGAIVFCYLGDTLSRSLSTAYSGMLSIVAIFLFAYGIQLWFSKRGSQL